MGQVVSFMAFKRAKNDDKFKEIEALEQRIAEYEVKLRVSPYVNVREQAVIDSLDCKMKIASIRQSLGIMQ